MEILEYPNVESSSILGKKKIQQKMLMKRKFYFLVNKFLKLIFNHEDHEDYSTNNKDFIVHNGYFHFFSLSQKCTIVASWLKFDLHNVFWPKSKPSGLFRLLKSLFLSVGEKQILQLWHEITKIKLIKIAKNSLQI